MVLGEDIIVAVATPVGVGALSVVRMSGAGAAELFHSVWRGRRLTEPRRVRLGKVVDAAGRLMDEGLAVFFAAPASYTGEEMIEFSGHGGVLVTRRVFSALVAAGARVADPGEFTQRAFLNGRLDLTQAEAVMDLIAAQTDLALRAAQEQLAGRLGEQISRLREETLGLLAHVEAFIDFPEEDIDPDTGSALMARMDTVRAAIAALLATADQGRVLREGVRTVIVGAPNVGKSSLLNRLLGFDRAIVSEIAGTTRDTIEEVIALRGLPLRLVDTAGLRESSDTLERAGIERSHAALALADLVVEVADGTRPRAEFTPVTTGRRRVLVLNKADLGEEASWEGVEAVRLSCISGDGLDALADEIERVVTHGSMPWSTGLVAVNARHQKCLHQSAAAIDAARMLLSTHQPPDLVAEELRAAMQALGEIVGQADSEELLGVIFGRFCIGK